MNLNKRIFASIFLFLSLIILPWWFYIPIGILITIFIVNYWEIIIFGFLIDVLYTTSPNIFHFEYTFTAFFVFLFLISFLLRDRLRIKPIK